MNILPKKRWHVRTRENIARVRRDEAAAAENVKIQKARSQKAETEARINLLREKTRARYQAEDDVLRNNEVQIEKEKLEHVNFFADLELGRVDHHKPNVEYEAEKKAEKEKYEQQIGYLTYLGQNINGTKDNTSWYNELPRRMIDEEPKKGIQEEKKIIPDPLTDIKRYLSVMSSCRSQTKKNFTAAETSRKRRLEVEDEDISRERVDLKKKERKKTENKDISRTKHLQSSKVNSPNLGIEKLRNERLAREKAEKIRSDALLAKLRGESVPSRETVRPPNVRQQYNSQFFPEIARQNAAISRRQQ